MSTKPENVDICLPTEEKPVEVKKPDCPKIVSSKVVKEVPKAEVRHIEFDKECPKTPTQIGRKIENDLFEACYESVGTALNRYLLTCPPPYPDLGKNARDIFDKAYHFGLIKLDVKTKSKSGVGFQSSGNSNMETGKIFGSLETKYRAKSLGITFGEKWTTDNKLGTEITAEDLLVKGFKLGGEFNFEPQTGKKDGKIKTAFLHPYLALNCDFNFVDSLKPLITASAVLGYDGWLAGYQLHYDNEKNEITQNNFALGFAATDFILHTNIDIPNGESETGQQFGGSIFHRITSRLETGIMLNWQTANKEAKFGMGCKYELDKDAIIRAKVNNNSEVGLGYQQRLRDGVTLFLSALIDGKSFETGNHKFGIGLEFEAD